MWLWLKWRYHANIGKTNSFKSYWFFLIVNETTRYCDISSYIHFWIKLFLERFDYFFVDLRRITCKCNLSRLFSVVSKEASYATVNIRNFFRGRILLTMFFLILLFSDVSCSQIFFKITIILLVLFMYRYLL